MTNLIRKFKAACQRLRFRWKAARAHAQLRNEWAREFGYPDYRSYIAALERHGFTDLWDEVNGFNVWLAFHREDRPAIARLFALERFARRR